MGRLHDFNFFANLALRGSFILLLLIPPSGCQLGRSSFQMNSNSPTPFFNFELLPRKKTTQLSQPDQDELAADTWTGSARQFAQPAGYQESESPNSLQLQLPRLSDFLNSEKEEELSFTGPKTVFSK